MAKADICRPLISGAFQAAMVGLKGKANKLFEASGNPALLKKSDDYFENVMGSLRTHLNDFAETKKSTMPPEQLAGVLKKMMNRSTLDLINSYRASYDMVQKFDRVAKGAKTEKELMNSITSLYQKSYNAIEGSAREFGSIVDNVFDTLATGGVRVNDVNIRNARTMFFDAISNEDGGMLRKHLVEDMGIRDADVDKTVFFALKDGSSKVPVLDIIARAVKKIDETTVGWTKKFAPYFNSIDEYVVNTNVSRDKLLREGKEALSEFIIQKADTASFTGKEDAQLEDVLKAVENYWNEKTKGSSFGVKSLFQSSKKVFGHRRIHFKDAESEWEFLQRFGATDSNFLYSAMSHKRSLMTKTTLYNIHGADLEFNADMLAEHIKGNKLVTDTKGVEQKIKESSDFIQNLSYSASLQDQAINDAYGAIQSFTSASLTGKSVVRDVTYDQTVYSAQQAALIKDTSVTKEWMKSVWELTKTALDGDYMDELTDMLEAQGFAINVAAHHQYQGVAESLTNFNKRSKTARAFDAIGAGVSKWTGADRVLRASKVNQHIHSSNIALKVIDGKMAKTNALASYLDEVGLGSKELEILRGVRRTQIHGKDALIDVNRITALPDESVKGIMQAGESATDTKRRLQLMYKDFIMEMSNDLSARTSLRGRLFPKTGGAASDSTLGLTTKFSNIALSQYYNQQRLMLRAAGQNPNFVGHTSAWDLKSPVMDFVHVAKGNPVAVGKWFTSAVATGMISLWIKDLISGNTPRDITPEAITEGLSLTGFGGSLGMVMNNMYYSDDILATPASSAILKPAYGIGKALISEDDGLKGERIKKAGAKAAKKMPFMDTWYTKAAVDAAFRKGMNIDMTSYERRKLDENNQEKLLP